MANGQDEMTAWATPTRIDREAIDAFSPMVFLLGMAGRAVGASAMSAVWGAMLSELAANAIIARYGPELGAGPRPESNRNIAADVALGFAGWMVQDALERRSAAKGNK